MKCEKCSKVIPADSVYCPYCGEDLTSMRYNVLESTTDDTIGSTVPVSAIQDEEAIDE